VPDQELTRKEEDAARGRPRPTDATEGWGSSPGICHEEVPSDQEIWPAPPESPDPVRASICATPFVSPVKRDCSHFMNCADVQ
jgi:hypothetical protein